MLPRHITPHHTTPHHTTPHHITSHHITSHHITSHHITSHHITSHHITSHHITSHHITSHPIPSHPIPSHHSALPSSCKFIYNTSLPSGRTVMTHVIALTTWRVCHWMGGPRKHLRPARTDLHSRQVRTMVWYHKGYHTEGGFDSVGIVHTAFCNKIPTGCFVLGYNSDFIRLFQNCS